MISIWKEDRKSRVIDTLEMIKPSEMRPAYLNKDTNRTETKIAQMSPNKKIVYAKKKEGGGE